MYIYYIYILQYTLCLNYMFNRKGIRKGIRKDIRKCIRKGIRKALYRRRSASVRGNREDPTMSEA